MADGLHLEKSYNINNGLTDLGTLMYFSPRELISWYLGDVVMDNIVFLW